MPFKIVNTEKKDVADKEFFRKTLEDGTTLYFDQEVYYRWGEATVEEDPRENGWSPGEELCATDFGLIDHEMNDGCWEEKYGYDDLPEEEKELIEEYGHAIDAGWESYDWELTFYGPVEITEVSE